MREAGQSIITSLALDQPIDVQDLGYEALMGTFSGLIYSGIGSGVRRAFGRYSKAVSDRQAAQEAKARAEVREKLLGDAAKTKTAARMPEKLEDFMREMQTAEGDADTKKIYVDGRAIIDVFQAETDRQIDAIGEKLGIPREGREDFRQSVRLGLDIELDAPHLIATIASDKQYQQLKDHIKDDPTGLSMYEAIALDEESARRVEQTLADFRAEIDKIKNEGGAIGKFRRDLVKDFHPHGIVEIDLQACHTYAVERHNIKRLADELGLPYASIETDYSRSDSGQITTRVSAFIEML